MEGPDSKKKRNPAATGTAAAGGGSGLTDGLIVDILARVPVKSICRFKCVSPSWRSLISHPDSRKRLPQTLAGFFYFNEFDSCVFVSLAAPPPWRSGRPRPPSLCDFAFLPANTGGGALDCCNGLVLLSSRSAAGSERHASSYIVCNPATEKWTTVPPVPEPTKAGKNCVSTILCFDPAVSPHFHVVRLLEADEDDGFTEDNLFEGFEIYSSETGCWVSHPHNSGWSPQRHQSRRTYFNGLLHFITDDQRAIAALDMKGQTKRKISVPRSREVELVGHSQGRLFYANRDDRNSHKLSIYVLEDNGRWTLKHCVNTSGMFAGAEYLQSGLLVGVAGIHPHCNSIFLFDSLQGRLMFYNMDSKSARVIRSVAETCLWSFVPYVPLYMETSGLETGN